MKALHSFLTVLGLASATLVNTACSSDDDEGGGSEQPASGGSSSGGSGSGGDSMASGGAASGGAATGGAATGGVPQESGGSAGSMATGGAGGDECMTILEAAAATPELSSLVAAVEASGIASALMAEDLTVFAPDNEAFDDLLMALGLSLDDLTAEQLIPILTYHVADSVVPSSVAVEVAEGDDKTFATLGGTITLTLDGEDLVIDAEEAGATVTAPDIETCNGVVHLIDAVLLPSITDIVVSQESLSGLKTLIEASDSTTVDVAAALDGPSLSESEEQWTLFAPDNAAVEALLGLDLGLSPEQITTALLYHAYTEGGVPAATALTLDTMLTMASSEMLQLTGDEEASTVTLTDGLGEESMVTTTDIYASNGIVHIIDGVLVPPSIASDLEE